ncbi:hypothetical protein IV73_GL000674 [Weissella kandleri]|uniref:HAD superfamily hydrolase n=1 Tax=Weissella kandleri TaxID=1616 RepID=A0A0R2JDR2_9LACO|nr:Cof-type HAD-IIB family hydrolase [Weissella kandleri]KRN75504.1 hypothetical protein IV73_GL000674 [Weissella kandleri]
MGRKLIGIDLDHTTLNEAGQVSPVTQKTLQAAQAAGHIVAIITGRPPRLTQDIYDQIGLKTPMINFNGGLGYNPNQSWADAYSYQVKREIVFDLVEQAPNLAVNTIVAEQAQQVFGQRFLGHEQGPTNLKFFPQDQEQRAALTPQNVQGDVNAILLHVTQNAIPQTQKWLKARYGKDQVTVKTWGADDPVIEVAPAGVAKDTGLQVLQRSFAIKSDDVYAFGDEMNDLEMLSYAKHGVLMVNGNMSLKTVANEMTDYTNDEDGLARYLQKVLKLDIQGDKK